MIVYLYFNYLHFTNPQFINKLKYCNSKYGICNDDNSLDIHLEENYYPYCRMKLSDNNYLHELINEFNNEIYKYILYP